LNVADYCVSYDLFLTDNKHTKYKNILEVSWSITCTCGKMGLYNFRKFIL